MKKKKRMNQFAKRCALGDSFKARKIISSISGISGISIDDIKGNRRFREFVNPRFFAIHLIREFTNLPLKAIGREFNNRDHTSIMHALQTVSDLSDVDARFKKELEETREYVLDGLSVKQPETT